MPENIPKSFGGILLLFWSFIGNNFNEEIFEMASFKYLKLINFRLLSSLPAC